MNEALENDYFIFFLCLKKINYSQFFMFQLILPRWISKQYTLFYNFTNSYYNFAFSEHLIFNFYIKNSNLSFTENFG